MFLLFRADAEEELVDWTRTKDGATIQARFTDYDEGEGQVTVAIASGKSRKLPFESLSQEHQERVLRIMAERAKIEEAASVGHYESVEIDSDGVKHTLHLYKPAGYSEGAKSNDNRPIVCLFDSGGRSKRLMERFTPAADELGWLVAGFDAYSNQRLKKLKHKRVREITQDAMEQVEELLEFDKKRIVYGGTSGGGFWSYQCSTYLTRRTAGIISCGGWMAKQYDLDYPRRMAVAIINGDKDDRAKPFEEPVMEVINRKRGTSKIFRFDGGHQTPPKEQVTEAMRWIHAEKEFPDVSS